MAGSRANWEDMIAELKKGDAEKAAEKKVVEVLQNKKARPTLGTGLAERGAGAIEQYRARQKKAMEEY